MLGRHAENVQIAKLTLTRDLIDLSVVEQD